MSAMEGVNMVSYKKLWKLLIDKETLCNDDIAALEEKYVSKSWRNNLDLLNAIASDDFYDNPVIDDDFSFIFSAESDILKISCNKFIYKNPPVYDGKGQYVWTQNKAIIRSIYSRAFFKAIKDYDVPKFNEPIMVLFVQNYLNKSSFVDLDNLSTKLFIDTVLVQGGLLLDDSPLSLTTCTL